MIAQSLEPTDTVLSICNDYLSATTTRKFPATAIVQAIQQGGRRTLTASAVDALARSRQQLSQMDDRPWESALALGLLDTLVPSAVGGQTGAGYAGYLALPVLQAAATQPQAWGQPDTYGRLASALVADTLEFEQQAATTDLRLRATRIRHLSRLLAELGEQTHAIISAHAVLGTLSQRERDALRFSVLPVSTLRHEYLFLRILQFFELTFVTVNHELAAASIALIAGEVGAAAVHLSSAAKRLRRAQRGWPALATLQPAAFHQFRDYTTGSSALQSHAYKLMEAYCRRPSEERLMSRAYHDIPAIRDKIQAGRIITLSDTLRNVNRLSTADVETVAALAHSARRLDEVYLAWKRSHYSLAGRLIGSRPGTGHTEGVSYLQLNLDEHLFDADVLELLRQRTGPGHVVEAGRT